MTRSESREILLISPQLPFPPSWGFGTRVFNLARQLARRHSVTVLCFAPHDAEDAVTSLSAVVARVEVVRRREAMPRSRRMRQMASLLSARPFEWNALHSRPMQVAIDQILATRPIDIVQVESSPMCTYRLPAALPLVLDEHNVEYELLSRIRRSEPSTARRLHAEIEHGKCRRLEGHLWRTVSACALTSERERAIVQDRAPGTPTVVVPNGVDVERFTPPACAPVPDSIVFTGLLTYRPNLDAAEYFVRRILPAVRRLHPAATVTIVGHGRDTDLERLRGPGVQVTGWVPDVRPWLGRGAVAVVPLRVGSGTRLKVLEALAMGKAVVSTTTGCEGIGVADGEHLLIADDPGAFAEKVVSVLDDAALARRLGQAGRALAVEEYSWSRCVEPLDALYDTLLATHATRPATAVRVTAEAGRG